MARIRHDLNTIYISGRLQESLRPVSRCALTAIVAPMGYGKTTAVNWFLAREAPPHCIRISVYSAHLAILWRSAQEAFAHAGFPFLRDYDCPVDAAGAGCCQPPIKNRKLERRRAGCTGRHGRWRSYRRNHRCNTRRHERLFRLFEKWRMLCRRNAGCYSDRVCCN